MRLKEYKNRIKNNFLLSSIFTVASLDILNKLLKGILIILLIRCLDIEEYSKYTLFITISTFVYSFFANGLYTTYVLNESERISRNGRTSIRLYKNNFYIISIINLALILFSLLLIIKDKNNILITVAFIYSFTICILELCKSYYLVNKNFKQSGKIVNQINIIIIISLLLMILLHRVNLMSIAILHIMVTGYFALINFKKIIKLISIDKEEFDDNIYISNYYKTSLWIMSYTALLAIFNQIDILIIKAFLNNESVAIYGVSFKYYTLMLSILPAIKTVLKIRTTQKDMLDDLYAQKEFMKMWIRKTSKIVIPMIIIVIFLSPVVLTTLNGKQYNDSIILFQIFCIGISISYIFSPSSNILMAMRKYKFMTSLAFLVCILNFVGNIVLVNSMGIIGVVIITVISHTMINLVSTFVVLKL